MLAISLALRENLRLRHRMRAALNLNGIHQLHFCVGLRARIHS